MQGFCPFAPRVRGESVLTKAECINCPSALQEGFLSLRDRAKGSMFNNMGFHQKNGWFSYGEMILMAAFSPKPWREDWRLGSRQKTGERFPHCHCWCGRIHCWAFWTGFRRRFGQAGTNVIKFTHKQRESVLGAGLVAGTGARRKMHGDEWEKNFCPQILLSPREDKTDIHFTGLESCVKITKGGFRHILLSTCTFFLV